MIIYKVINKINGKCYIGQTIHSLQRRKSFHINYALKKKDKMIFHFAIKKYGKKNFIWEIIEQCKNKKELNKREKYWIKKLKTSVPIGYNLNNGGNSISGFGHSEQFKKLASERMKKNNPLFNEKIKKRIVKKLNSKKSRLNLKKALNTPEERKRRSEAIKGDKNPMRRFPEKNWRNNPKKQAEIRRKRYVKML